MTSQTGKRPNILFVMTDQQRWDALGAAGNPHIRTPQLDRLCRTGVRFVRGYSEMPECVPARAMLATGQWGHATKVMSNADKLPEETATFYKRLADSGYRTVAIGKMHVNPQVDLGFSRRLLLDGVPGPQDDYAAYVRSAGYGHVTEPHGIRNKFYYIPQVSQLPEEHHGTVWIGDHAVEFIESSAGEAPWFAHVSFLKPHPPFDLPLSYLDAYDPESMPLPARCEQDRERAFDLLQWQTYFKWMERTDDNLARLIKASYYALVEQIDVQIGRLLDALERTGQRESTLVVFVSDHGELLGDHYQWGKRFFYDGAMRVPYILSQPGTLPQGAEHDALVGLADLEATVMAAAGLNPGGRGLDVRRLAMEPEKSGRRYAFGEFGQGPTALFMAWDGTWKYIFSPNGDRELLFNGAADRDELTDLSAEPSAAQEKQRLRRALASFLREEGLADALDADGMPRSHPHVPIPSVRYQRRMYMKA